MVEGREGREGGGVFVRVGGRFGGKLGGGLRPLGREWREWAGGLGGEVRERGVGFRSLGGVSRGSGKARWGSFRREGEAWVGLVLGKGGRAWGEEEMA